MTNAFLRSLRGLAASAALAVAATSPNVHAQAAKYGPGASATEIKLGQTMPYSGPASAYGTIGKLHQAYFKMINDNGGINGRKVNLISLDDGYSPPKTVEQVRRLVEQHSESFEQPDQLVRWYYGDPARLAEFEALAMEDNVVEWAMGKMKVEDKPTEFDELMGTKKG